MKKTKVPKLFKKPLSEKKLNRKILRRIHVESERKFLNSKLEKREGDLFYLPEELSKEDLKHLRKIAKAVKKNRGVLVGWKAAIILVLILGISGFNFFLKNRLFETAAENALENIFNGAADMEEPRLSLLQGTVTFSHLTLADEDRPMRNLIELGDTVLSLDMPRVLSRRIIINEVSCKEIQFGTERAISGALPDRDPEEGSEEPGKSSGNAVEEVKTLSLEIGRQSAENLIDQYRESLRSPELIESVREQYTDMNERWVQRIEQSDSRMETLEAQSQDVLSTDISSIDTVTEIESYLGKLDTLQSSIRDTRSFLDQTYSEYQADTASIRDTRGAIDTAIEEDIDFLKDAVGSFRSDAAGMISSTARPILREKLGKIYIYGEKVLKIYNRLQNGSEKKQSRFADKGRRGTTVSFPYRDYPSFLIKKFEISSGASKSSDFTELLISDITGDQETWGKPATATFSGSPPVGGTRTPLRSELSIDTRDSAEFFMESNTDIAELPVQISEGLNTLSIASMQAVSDNSIQLSLKPDLSGEGSANILLSGMEITYSDTESIVGNALSQILRDIDSAVIEADFGFADGTLTDLKVRSDLDQLLGERLGEYAREQADQAAEEAEKLFYDYIEDELAANESLNREISRQGSELIDDIRATESLETAIEERKEALKAKAQAEVEQKAKELKDQAKDKLEDIGKDLKLPGF